MNALSLMTLVLLAGGVVIGALLVKHLGARGVLRVILGVGVVFSVVVFVLPRYFHRTRAAPQTVAFTVQDGQHSVVISSVSEPSGCNEKVELRATADENMERALLSERQMVYVGSSPSEGKQEVAGPACEPPEYISARDSATPGSVGGHPPPVTPRATTAPAPMPPNPARAPWTPGWLSGAFYLPWAILSAVALAAMIYLAYLFLDSGTRGHFTWPLRIFAVLAFVGICLALTLARRGF